MVWKAYPTNGDRIRELREAAGLSRVALARKIGVSDKTIQRAEKGDRIDAEMIDLLAKAFDVPREELLSDQKDGGKDAKLRPSAAMPHSTGTAPPLPSLVIGRDAAIADIKKRMTGRERSVGEGAPQMLLALRGWPGVGKSTLAAALGHDEGINAEFPDGVLWSALGRIDWSTKTTRLLGKLKTWGRAIGIDRIEHSKHVEDARACLAGALRDRRMLLIVDDVWDKEDAEALRVGGRYCGMVVTTRVTDVARALAPTAADVLSVDGLSTEDGLRLLQALAPAVVEEHPEECERLVESLEGLPLALKVAGRLLFAEADMGLDVDDLLEELSDPEKLLDAHAPPDFANVDYQSTQTVAALLHKSTDCLSGTLRDRFALLGGLAPDPAVFSTKLLAEVWDIAEAEARRCARELVNRGLIEPAGDGQFQIHSLLAAHARRLMEQAELEA